MTYLELLNEIRTSLAMSLSDEWGESIFAPGTQPRRKGKGSQHLVYSVGIPDSRRLQGNQRSHLAMSSMVTVEWTFTLENKRERESYGAALEAEAEMLRALASIKDDLGEPALGIERIERGMLGDSLLVVEITCSIPHPVTLD